MANRDVQLTLEESVAEVLGLLTGLELSYVPEMERFRTITRSLNRAMRSVALEHEWSYYSSVEEVGTAAEGLQDVEINSSLRPRIISDDAIRLNNDNGKTVRWCYFLPWDALHKYAGRSGLWASVVKTTITFSRPFFNSEDGLRILVPVMREPKMFELPDTAEDVPARILNQPIDFDYPDLVILRAAYFYAQTDPVMQPRVQTLEAQYKDVMYQLVERDDRHTDSPFLNDFTVPIQADIEGSTFNRMIHPHPHSDERWR